MAFLFMVHGVGMGVSNSDAVFLSVSVLYAANANTGMN